jgi:hypothetical protein
MTDQKGDNPAELLVCKGCGSMTHTFCKENALPDGQLRAGQYFCEICRPLECPDDDLASKVGYLDIWDDQESLDHLQRGSPIVSSRARDRASRYQWDSKRQLLLTRELVPRIVSPPNKRSALARAAHVSLGHRGRRGVTDGLRLHYTWKGMEDDVSATVTACNPCQSQTLALQPLRATPLQPIPQAQMLGKWTVDLIGPMVDAIDTGHKHIAVTVGNWW